MVSRETQTFNAIYRGVCKAWVRPPQAPARLNEFTSSKFFLIKKNRSFSPLSWSFSNPPETP